jgi:hypothetical protein
MRDKLVQWIEYIGEKNLPLAVGIGVLLLALLLLGWFLDRQAMLDLLGYLWQ